MLLEMDQHCHIITTLKTPFIVTKQSCTRAAIFHAINYFVTHLCKHPSTVNPNELGNF